MRGAAGVRAPATSGRVRQGAGCPAGHRRDHAASSGPPFSSALRSDRREHRHAAGPKAPAADAERNAPSRSGRPPPLRIRAMRRSVGPCAGPDGARWCSTRARWDEATSGQTRRRVLGATPVRWALTALARLRPLRRRPGATARRPTRCSRCWTRRCALAAAYDRAVARRARAGRPAHPAGRGPPGARRRAGPGDRHGAPVGRARRRAPRRSAPRPVADLRTAEQAAQRTATTACPAGAGRAGRPASARSPPAGATHAEALKSLSARTGGRAGRGGGGDLRVRDDRGAADRRHRADRGARRRGRRTGPGGTCWSAGWPSSRPAPRRRRPGYELPFEVTDRASALKLAVQVEDGVAQAWRAVLPATDGADRSTPLSALIDAAVRATRWRRLAA